MQGDRMTDHLEHRARVARRRQLQWRCALAMGAIAAIMAGGGTAKLVYDHQQRHDDSRWGPLERQVKAMLSATRAAVASTKAPVRYLKVQEVDQRIDESAYVLTGDLWGQPHEFLTRKWEFIAHLERRCEAPSEACWRVLTILADGRLIYTDPPRSPPQRRETPASTPRPQAAPMAWPVEWRLR